MTFDSLDALEAKIQEAAERLVALAESNAELERRVEELENERDSASAGGGSEWQEEKLELKRRVDQLVARLEELLREA